MGSKTLRILFNKIDRFIKMIVEIYLVLLGYNCYDEIYDRIKYLLSKESRITNSINHHFARIRVD